MRLLTPKADCTGFHMADLVVQSTDLELDSNPNFALYGR